jgi:peptidoglycan/xylan/chitin deacetylase (PgdA/CDA1 family)
MALIIVPGLCLALDRPSILNPAQVVDSGFKRIAFTFDDGPKPPYTGELVNELAKSDIRATFFVVGRQAQKYPNLVREILARGHEVANHSWDHPSVRTLSAASLKAELDKTRVFLKQLTGQDTPLFRAPGGTVKYLRHEIVVPEGYEMVLWTVHTLDQEKPTARLIRERVLSGARDGAVILFHNGIRSTMDALPDLIRTLRSEGYVFVTVSELLGKAPVSLASARPVPR